MNLGRFGFVAHSGVVRDEEDRWDDEQDEDRKTDEDVRQLSALILIVGQDQDDGGGAEHAAGRAEHAA